MKKMKLARTLLRTTELSISIVAADKIVTKLTFGKGLGK